MTDFGRDNKVPGAGNYSPNTGAIFESVRSGKFGSGQRSTMENKAVRVVPGPGTHSPDF